MKFTVTITGTKRPSEYTIGPGESIELPLDWVDPSGQPIDLSGSSVRLKVKNSAQVLIYEQLQLPDPTSLSIPAAITSGWKTGPCQVELWFTDSAGRVGEGQFRLWLKD